jgi:hypothetical protein
MPKSFCCIYNGERRSVFSATYTHTHTHKCTVWEAGNLQVYLFITDTVLDIKHHFLMSYYNVNAVTKRACHYFLLKPKLRLCRAATCLCRMSSWMVLN